MEEQTMSNKQEAALFFTGHAIQGVLSGNSLMCSLPKEVATKAIAIGKEVANAMFPEVEASATDEAAAE